MDSIKRRLLLKKLKIPVCILLFCIIVIILFYLVLATDDDDEVHPHPHIQSYNDINEDILHNSFRYFHEILRKSDTGLYTSNFIANSSGNDLISIASVGYGLISLTIGVEKNYISREDGFTNF